MARVTYEAPAKINLALTIEGKRPDGFHQIRTIFQAIDWCDRLHVERRAEPGITLDVSDPTIPTDERNLVARAWRAVTERVEVAGGVSVRLEKRIPHGAGLGGGSSDAAAMLAAAVDLFDLEIDGDALSSIAASIGSDVAFFLRGGTQLGTGRGEILEPIEHLEVGAFLVASPSIVLATADVYRAGAFELTPSDDPLTLLRLGIAREDPEGVARGLFNALEGPAFSLRPELKRLKGQLLAKPALGALLCGSGASLFAYFGEEEDARRRATSFDGEVASRVVLPRPDGVRRVE